MSKLGLQVIRQIFDADISPAFLSGVAKHLPNAEITVDWFYIVQIFSNALDEVRRQESQSRLLPRNLYWAIGCGLRMM